MSMTPVYPAEWLLDIFHNGAKCRRSSRLPYMCVITTPPISFMLREVAGIPNWFLIVLALTGIEIFLGVKICQ